MRQQILKNCFRFFAIVLKMQDNIIVLFAV